MPEHFASTTKRVLCKYIYLPTYYELNYFAGCGIIDCKATESELAVWTQVQSVLQRTDAILHDLSYYTGAATEIRDVRTA